MTNTYLDFYFLIITIICLITLLIWPSWPIIIGYPLTWIIGPFSLEIIGGRPERVFGILGIAGVAILALMKKLKKNEKLFAFPPLVNIGIFLLLGGYSYLWISNFGDPRGNEYILSLTTRIILFYLFYYHVSSQSRISKALTLFIIMGFIAGLYVLYISLTFGFGFSRVYESYLSASNYIGPFGNSILLSANYLGAPALLVLGLFPYVKQFYTKIAVLLGSSFLFLMAFTAQFRREILISIPISLLFWYFTTKNNKRGIFLMIIIWIILLSVVILPSQVLQDRLRNETSAIINLSETRIVNFNAGMKAFANNPFGYGPGKYEATVYSIMGPQYYSFQYHAYNVFIWIAVEGGVLALIGLLLIIFPILKYASHRGENNSLTESWVLDCGPTLMVQLLFWFSFGNSWDHSVPWFIMGFILAAYKLQETKRMQKRAVDQPNVSDEKMALSW